MTCSGAPAGPGTFSCGGAEFSSRRPTPSAGSAAPPDASRTSRRLESLLPRASRSEEASLRLTPSLFDTLMLAARFRTPPGPDAPELAALELFYSEIARGLERPEKIQIASAGELKTVTAPDMEAAFDGRL